MGSATVGYALLHLLVFMCACGSGAREISSKLGEADDVLRLHGDEAHPASHMAHMDPSVLVFFIPKDLKLGSLIPIHFPKRDPSSSPKFIPRETADMIPFSSAKLHYLLSYFKFSPGSPQATAMGDTLRQCEARAIESETKFCATSLESLLDFTRGALGSDAHIKVLATKHLSKSDTRFQKYAVSDEPRAVPARRVVGCHTMPYPYAVFYCHTQESETQVFEVSLKGENGDLVEAVAVCHMDTSLWSPDHVSFKILGVHPGSSPVCHFFPSDHLVWVSSTSPGN
uniref:BURP domain-containing protein n=1 Tax=Kalanchoe fedtschenkoi TaxID=63787 RepID=A0A7N0T1Y8_KALFE